MCPEPSAATDGSHWSPVVRPTRFCVENCGGAAQARLARTNTNTANLDQEERTISLGGRKTRDPDWNSIAKGVAGQRDVPRLLHQ